MFKKLANNFIGFFKRKQFAIEGFLNQIVGKFTHTFYKYSYTATEFLTLCHSTYNKNADLQEGIDKIVKAISGFDLVVKNKNGDEIPLPQTIRDWLNSPSVDYSTYHNFIKSAFIQYYISGEIFYLKDYNKKMVSLVRPNEVNEVRVLDGFPMFYRLSHTFFNRTKLMNYEEQSNYIFETEYKQGRPMNQISHFYNRNPVLDFRGLSIIVSMINDLEILYKGKTWNRSLLENEGRPSGVFYYQPGSAGASEEFDTSADPIIASKDKLDEEIKHFYSGAENAGKYLVLKSGLKFEQVAYKMKDVDFIEGLRFSRESIANRLGIPLQMFGSEKKSTYNNMREARTSFYLDTCVPLANEFFLFLSKEVIADFFPAFKDYYLCVDTLKIQQTSDRYLETLTKLDALQYLTINEKRELIGKKPLPLENTDTLLIKQGVQDVEDLGNEPMGEDGDDMFDKEDDDDNEDEDKEETEDKDEDKEDDKKEESDD